MDYVNKIPPLEEMVSAQVAIHLCQGTGFKEIALSLEKPTYGCCLSVGNYLSLFVSDPEKLSVWAKVKGDDRLRESFVRSCYPYSTEKDRRWKAAIDEQCHRLTEGIPSHLRREIHSWINRMALEYLSYCQRLEAIGLSRYFLMDVFTRGDWKGSARLDEQRLAQRLLEDERLTILQRYRIACSYCLEVHICQLWNRLTQEEKRHTRKEGRRSFSWETNDLVLLWSHYMNGNVSRNDPWISAVYQATRYGNRTALMRGWKRLNEPIQQCIIINMALECFRKWQMKGQSTLVKYSNLPSYYSELMRFFLSQMDGEQQLTFFTEAFRVRNHRHSVLECFLVWPYQDDFLPTINRLWELIPKEEYVHCLLAIANMYSENDKKENRDYDYRSLLETFWEKTPEEYKQYVFCDRNEEYSLMEGVIEYLGINYGESFLSRLLERSPFEEKDEDLFKRIFRDQPQEKRRAMMLSRGENLRSKGEDMCSLLIQKGKWSFLNWLLGECLPKEKIPGFKERFIESHCGVKLCMDSLEDNRKKLVEDLLDWSLECDTQKMRWKNALIKKYSFRARKALLLEGGLGKVERLIEFCLSLDDEKEQFKAGCVGYACQDLLNDYYSRDSLLEDCVWEQMDTIMAWSVDKEEKIRHLKKNLFSSTGVGVHYKLVFIVREWGKVKSFYQWFDLSPQEIKILIKDTIFSAPIIENIARIYDALKPEHTNTLLASLRWCLTDEEMVIDFQNEVEKEYFTEFLDNKKKLKRFNNLMRELLDGFRKEVQGKRSGEGIFVKGTEEKRSVETEDESSESKKRRM